MNSQNIEINGNLSNASGRVKEAKNIMMEIESTLNDTEIKLNEKGWVGLSNKKCVQVNGLLKAYGKEIELILEDIEGIIDALERNKKSFNSKKTRATNLIKLT